MPLLDYKGSHIGWDRDETPVQVVVCFIGILAGLEWKDSKIDKIKSQNYANILMAPIYNFSERLFKFGVNLLNYHRGHLIDNPTHFYNLKSLLQHVQLS